LPTASSQRFAVVNCHQAFGGAVGRTVDELRSRCDGRPEVDVFGQEANGTVEERDKDATFMVTAQRLLPIRLDAEVISK
jgi:hypothetical protein